MRESFDILSKLVPWMKAQPLKYPWQLFKTPYHIWVSEVMLQQTVVTAVVGFFNRWIERFPTVFDLASAQEEEVLRTFEGLGYYSRARNMHRCAQVLVEKYGGEFPSTYDELVSLPGIGDYTARAILSFSFHQPYLLVDANVKRVMRRLALQEEWTSAFEESYLGSLSSYSAEDKRYINEGIMRLGQEICLKTKPLCLICPVQSGCLAKEAGRQDIVSPQKRQTTSLASTVYLLISHSSVYLIKGQAGRFKGFYVFPKIEKQKALSLDILEGIGYHDPLGSYVHTYTRFKELLEVHVVGLSAPLAPASLGLDPEGEWFDISRVEDLPLPSVYRKIWKDFLLKK